MSDVNKKTIKERVKNAFGYLFFGYGWKPFLLRMCIVCIAFYFNSFDFAVHSPVTGPMKFFLMTCAFLACNILKLVLDYSKLGKEFESKKDKQ
jgi:hypothetical protein